MIKNGESLESYRSRKEDAKKKHRKPHPKKKIDSATMARMAMMRGK
jgi:hypothetical protein